MLGLVKSSRKCYLIIISDKIRFLKIRQTILHNAFNDNTHFNNYSNHIRKLFVKFKQLFKQYT